MIDDKRSKMAIELTRVPNAPDVKVEKYEEAHSWIRESEVRRGDAARGPFRSPR
jgi:hypothetical protein